MCFFFGNQRNGKFMKIQNQELTAAHQIFHNSSVKVKKEKVQVPGAGCYIFRYSAVQLIACPPSGKQRLLRGTRQFLSVTVRPQLHVFGCVKKWSNLESPARIYLTCTHMCLQKLNKGSERPGFVERHPRSSVLMIQSSCLVMKISRYQTIPLNQMENMKTESSDPTQVVFSFTVMQGRCRGISIDVTEMMCLLVIWTSDFCLENAIKHVGNAQNPYDIPLYLLIFLGSSYWLIIITRENSVV